MRTAATILFAIVMLGGCERGFDPRGTFENRLVVFGLLSPSTDTVMFRLQATYDLQGADPMSHTTEPDLSGGTATLSWDRYSASLRDTVVPHPNAERYSNGLRILTTSPLRVERGMTYTVRVDVPGYPRAEATAKVPSIAPFYFRNEALLSNPSSFTGLDLELFIGLPPEAFGYLPNLQLEYEVLSEGGRVERREVPSRLAVSAADVKPEYPTLQGSTAEEPRYSYGAEAFRYEGSAYRFLIRSIVDQYGAANIRYRRAILYLTLVDEHAYKYTFLVNGFFDPITVRTDQPDYSNVNGGVGMVGAFVVDSLTVPLPAVIQ